MKAAGRRPAILPGLTFHEGRHTHRTWLAEDGIPEVARAARLGHTVPGMGGVYEHVTPEMKQRILDVLRCRWESSLLALRPMERRQLVEFRPRLSDTINRLHEQRREETDQANKIIARISPR